MAEIDDPASPPRFEILAISGSLRRASINSAVPRAAAQAAARDGRRVALANSVRSLPSFDPDQDTEPPESARRFRNACEDAAGVLLAVSEYTFGMPGAPPALRRRLAGAQPHPAYRRGHAAPRAWTHPHKE